VPPPPPDSVPLVTALALVAAGGAAGSMARYLIALAATPIAARFPAGTLCANVLGCLFAGVLLFFVMQRDQPSIHLRLLVATGFLGGLTTFSTFGFETVHLLQRGQTGAAVLNIAANVMLSLGAVYLGFAGARSLG
jgi:fluoride exporter